jgi:hypothetical protein
MRDPDVGHTRFLNGGLLSGRSRPRLRRRHPPPGEPFLLVIFDHDNRRFVIEGPMTDAEAWIREVIAARRSGRRISCRVFAGSIEEAVRYCRRARRGTQWPSRSIILPP